MSQIPKLTRAAVLERDGQSCLRCGHSVEGRPYSVHHRKGRQPLPGMPDPHILENLVTLCGTGSTQCHAHVHQHPAESYRDGWLIHRSGPDDPAAVPVTDLMGHAWLLTNEALVPVPDSSVTALPGGAAVAFPGGPVRGDSGHPTISHPSKEISA